MPLKAIVFFEDDNSGTISHCDVVEFEGIVWLVPMWLENKAEGYKSPARIVSFQHIPHQHHPGSPFGDYTLNAPVSRAIFDGAVPPKGSPYRVIQQPNIRLPLVLS